MVSVQQNEEKVFITIPLNKVNSNIRDVEINGNFIKFHCPPTYFEACLFEEVAENESKCYFLKREAKLTLKKKIPALWPNIIKEITREESINFKKELASKLEERNKALQTFREEKKSNIKKTEIQKQVDRESNVHKRIEELNRIAVNEHFSSTQKSDFSNTENKETELSNPVEDEYIFLPEVRACGTIITSFTQTGSKAPKRDRKP